MLSDVLTKDMPADHLREAPARGTWIIELREEMAKTARRVARERWGACMRELFQSGTSVPGALAP